MSASWSFEGKAVDFRAAKPTGNAGTATNASAFGAVPASNHARRDVGNTLFEDQTEANVDG